DVTVTWDGEFELNGPAAQAQNSNPENSQESIGLQTETSEGVTVRFLMSVFPNSRGDATAVATLLLNDSTELAAFFGDDAEVIESVVEPDASALLIRTSDD